MGGDVVERARRRVRVGRVAVGEDAEAERHRVAVDDGDGDLVGDGARGELGALHRRRQCTAERHRDDAGGAFVGELAVRLLELAGRRCGRLGQRRRRRAARPELGRREVAAVDELLVADADRQRHDLDPELVGDALREIAGGVGDDADAHDGGSVRGQRRPARATPASPQRQRDAGERPPPTVAAAAPGASAGTTTCTARAARHRSPADRDRLSVVTRAVSTMSSTICVSGDGSGAGVKIRRKTLDVPFDSASNGIGHLRLLAVAAAPPAGPASRNSSFAELIDEPDA